MTQETPIIAIVGRSNVGKSTLFNSILGKKVAVVEDEPGITRDRNYALVERFALPFYLVDTGGFPEDTADVFCQAVLEQTNLAIEEADLLICLFDGNVGVQPDDENVVRVLRKSGAKVFYAVNKCDGKEQSNKVNDFYSLGLDSLTDISARYGHGLTEFVNTILRTLPNYEALVAEKMAVDQEVEKREDEAVYQFSQHVPWEDEFASSGESDAELGGASLAEGAIGTEGGAGIGTESFERFAAADQGSGLQTAHFVPVYIPGESSGTLREYEATYRTVPLPLARSLRGEPEELTEEDAVQTEIPKEVRVALVGRPNVGKSTLLNTLLGEARAITSPIAGTTRDSLNEALERDGQRYVVVDTAGLRRKGRVVNRVERYSVVGTLRSIRECDVAIILIDALEGPTDQDAKIAGLVHDQGKGMVIAVNKWDAIEKDHRTVNEFHDKVKEMFKFAPYAPVVIISAISGRRCAKLLPVVKEIAEARSSRVPTPRLNRIIRKALVRQPLSTYRGRPIKFYFATQVSVSPPRIVLFFSRPKEVHFSHLRYLKNCLRDELAFIGTDIKLFTRAHHKS